MYIIELINGETVTQIHGVTQKVYSGSVVKGINTINSFTFTLLPSNTGINQINDFQTFVTIFNTNKNRYEFQGRAIYSDVSMDSKGLITKEVTCESYLGFLCDSQQVFKEEQNWTIKEFLEHIIDTHNSQVEEYKQFAIGEVTVTDPNNNLYIGIHRTNTWKTITEKLIGTLGGEIRFRVEGGIKYLDYLEEIGETRTTAIAMSHNMKSIRRSNDPTAYITRLIPLGCKLVDEETGKETEERLDITSVNNGINYIEDENARIEYGIKVEYAYFDDVTDAASLLAKGREYLAENNKVQVKYSISALDLSLLGLDIDDFEVHNYYPIKNSLLGIDDTARIIKKTINVCEEIQSTIEVGDNFKTLSDLQIENSKTVEQLSDELKRANDTTSTAIADIQKVLEKQSTTTNISIESEATNISAVTYSAKALLGVKMFVFHAQFTAQEIEADTTVDIGNVPSTYAPKAAAVALAVWSDSTNIDCSACITTTGVIKLRSINELTAGKYIYVSGTWSY